jgi:O-antigen ligase
VLVLLAIRWLARLVRGDARRGWPLAWPVGVFAVASVAAALLSAHPLESLVSARTVLLLASLWIVRDALRDAAEARIALLALLGVLGVASAVGIAQVLGCAAWPGAVARLADAAPWLPLMPWLTKLGTKCHRARGFFSIYMTLAGVLNVALLAALPVLVWSRGRPRRAPLVWLLDLVAFLLTYVRGAWLGFAAGVAVLGGSLRRGRGVLFACLVALAVALLLLPGVRARMRSIADPRDPTSSERVLMWKSGLAIARDHLLAGVGPGQVKRVYPHYAAPEVFNKYRGHVHNSPLQILIERGIVGFVAWVSMFAAFFVYAARAARRLPEESGGHALVIGAISAIAGFLVGALFEHSFGDSEVLLAATFVMGLAFVVADS